MQRLLHLKFKTREVILETVISRIIILQIKQFRFLFYEYATHRPNPFIPKFLKWTLPSLNLNLSIDSNRGFSQKAKQNSKQYIGPDETARDEPSHLDLYCLHGAPFRSARLKGLILIQFHYM